LIEIGHTDTLRDALSPYPCLVVLLAWIVATELEGRFIVWAHVARGWLHFLVDCESASTWTVTI